MRAETRQRLQGIGRQSHSERPEGNSFIQKPSKFPPAWMNKQTIASHPRHGHNAILSFQNPLKTHLGARKERLKRSRAITRSTQARREPRTSHPQTAPAQLHSLADPPEGIPPPPQNIPTTYGGLRPTAHATRESAVPPGDESLPGED